MGKSRWYRLALSVLLLISIIWLWSSRFDELAYHTWGKSELIDLGDATAFSKLSEQVPNNSFVMVSGILGNKAATISGLKAGSFRFGRYQIRHLLGSKLYIEYNEAQYHQTFSPFKEVTVKGRLTSFGPNSHLAKVRTFFKDYYKQPVDNNAMLIVVDETPKSEIGYAVLFALSLVLLFISFYSSYRAFRTKEIDT